MSSQAFGSQMDQIIPFWTAQLVTSRATLFRVTNEKQREVSTLHLSACRPIDLLTLSVSANDAVNCYDYAASVLQKSGRNSFTSLNNVWMSLSPSKFAKTTFLKTVPIPNFIRIRQTMSPIIGHRQMDRRIWPLHKALYSTSHRMPTKYTVVLTSSGVRSH